MLAWYLLDHVTMMFVQQWRKRIMAPAVGFVFALACLLAAAIFLPRVLVGIDVGPYQLDQMTAGAQASAINSIRSTLLQGIGGAAVIAGAYIAWRQLHHNIDDSRSQRELERQASLTEWFNNAVEHLGSAELATRLGGIYALDRIGRDSAADRLAIVDILAAYVRMSSPWPPAAQAGFPPQYPLTRLPPMTASIRKLQGCNSSTPRRPHRRAIFVSGYCRLDLLPSSTVERRIADRFQVGPEAFLTLSHRLIAHLSPGVVADAACAG